MVKPYFSNVKYLRLFIKSEKIIPMIKASYGCMYSAQEIINTPTALKATAG